MVTEKIQNRAENAIATVKCSSLSPATKDALIEAVTESRDACNGLTQEEKTQKIAESQFNLTWLFVTHAIESTRKTSWKDVIIACRHEIVIASGMLFLLFALRPQLAQMMETIFQ